ncbi:MAG: hypothetical protein ACTILK_00320 [Bifidobacterium crudilactis]|uniref:hypothetical protein n=1 Tax=Bifidobacterium crudilactis TaxID=327277 RepID=UPI003F96EE1D
MFAALAAGAALLVTVVWLLVSDRPNLAATNPTGSGVVWEHGTGTQTPKQPESVSFTGYPSLDLKEGETTAHLPISNKQENGFAIKYQLVDETGDILWESGLIAPGVTVGEQKLSRALPVGETHATWHMTSWTLDEQPVQLNGVDTACTITVTAA